MHINVTRDSKGIKMEHGNHLEPNGINYKLWIISTELSYLYLKLPGIIVHSIQPSTLPSNLLPSPSVMSKCPTCKVVDSRPSTDTLNGNSRCRTSEQVKKDLDAKTSAATEA
jgi:hypothetical protein